MKLNLKDFKRFEKQIILKKIGISGQKKIKNSNVLIIGMGGLGCPLLTYLVSSGVNNIGIVDHDKVEISNLNRQILFNPSEFVTNIIFLKFSQGTGKSLSSTPLFKFLINSFNAFIVYNVLVCFFLCKESYMKSPLLRDS